MWVTRVIGRPEAHVEVRPGSNEGLNAANVTRPAPPEAPSRTKSDLPVVMLFAERQEAGR
jgi:hypothetical protein